MTSKIQTTLTRMIELFFLTLFLYTGGYKLADHASFEGQMASVLPSHLVNTIVSWSIPGIELTIAFLLWFKKTGLIGLYLSGILMLSFTIYLAVMAYATPNLSCGCGGIIEQLSVKNHLLFNSLCVMLAVTAIILRRRMQRSAPVDKSAPGLPEYVTERYQTK